MAFGRDRDLYKTKLCTLYLQRGSCPRQTCSFAHGGAELRRTPGHPDPRNFGPWSRFDRQSPMSRLRRSHSKERRGRGFRRSPLRDRDLSRSPAKRRRSRSPSAPESSECKRRNSKNVRSEANDAHPSDVSAEDIGTDSGGLEKDVKTQSIENLSHIRDSLEEQMAEVQDENKVLLDQKIQLELVLETKLHETTELSDKVTILDEKVAGVQEDCKGLASKTRKLVKVYKGFVRAQEDLKKAQAKLVKLVDDVIVESYNKVNMDIDNMKVLLQAHASILGDHETTHDGPARKDIKGNTPSAIESRPMSQVSEYNCYPMPNGLQQVGVTTPSNNNVGDCKSIAQAFSGAAEGVGYTLS